MITYACWQKRFASAQNIVGQHLRINNRLFTIIGVTPDGFRGTEVAYAPEVFVPNMMAQVIEPGSTWLDHVTATTCSWLGV